LNFGKFKSVVDKKVQPAGSAKITTTVAVNNSIASKFGNKLMQAMVSDVSISGKKSIGSVAKSVKQSSASKVLSAANTEQQQPAVKVSKDKLPSLIDVGNFSNKRDNIEIRSDSQIQAISSSISPSVVIPDTKFEKPFSAQITQQQQSVSRIYSEESEIYSGGSDVVLQDSEKPFIFSIVEQDINNNRFPTSIAIIVRKLKSDRFRAVEYKIFKKNIFTEKSYKEVFSIRDTISASINQKYYETIFSSGISPFDVFVFVDEHIQEGCVYGYKLYLEYDGNVDASITQRSDVQQGVSDVSRQVVESLVGSDISNPVSVAASKGRKFF
jgi:hypothetical protein